MAMILITHDMGVVAENADRVIVNGMPTMMSAFPSRAISSRMAGVRTVGGTRQP